MDPNRMLQHMLRNSQRTFSTTVQPSDQQPPTQALAPQRGVVTDFPLTEALILDDFLYPSAPTKQAFPATGKAPVVLRLETSQLHEMEGYADSVLLGRKVRAAQQTTHLPHVPHPSAEHQQQQSIVVCPQAAASGVGEGCQHKKKRRVLPDAAAIRKFSRLESQLAKVFGWEA